MQINQSSLALIEQFAEQWQQHWGMFTPDASLAVSPDVFEKAWATYTQRLMGNYPFHHPRYAGQMIKPPHPVAMLGYMAAMFINPNNHALDGGPPTSEMEKEVIKQLAAMFGLPNNTLGHLTSSGTIANLEALWVANKLHPNKKIAFSADAHYTHERICSVLGIETIKIPTNNNGTIDTVFLADLLQTDTIGTVVATAGTTGLGMIDAINELLDLQKIHPFRIHVDAAYGGFFRLLADDEQYLGAAAQSFRAIAHCNSVVIDPHKHGLQPYGCGCVLFSDPNVGRFYQHDSPYTYFTSNELHLGEISLECSRAGAAAGALWLTLQCIPLKADTGLGAVLKQCITAAQNWAKLLDNNSNWQLFIEPQLDIIAYFPKAKSTAEVDELSYQIFDTAMNASPTESVFVSLYNVDATILAQKFGIEANTKRCRILRSALLKPEHAQYVPYLHQQLSHILHKLQNNYGR